MKESAKQHPPPDQFTLTQEDGHWMLRRLDCGETVLCLRGTKAEAVKESVEYVLRRGGSLRLLSRDGGSEERLTPPPGEQETCRGG